jgi:hypothetical protein
MWVHIREEDQPGVRVFRPAGHPRPPARGRDAIEFLPDGTARAFTPGPVDAPVGRPATWRAEPDGTLVIDSDEGERRYEIVALTDAVLRLSLAADPRPPAAPDR